MTRTTIIDGWLDAAAIATLAEEWPTDGWFRYDQDHQRKATLSDWRQIPPPHRRVLSRMATEFAGRSIPDLGLWGAGLCEMLASDYLGEHLDHDVHPHLGLRRTHNAILFLGGDGDLIVGRDGRETNVRPVAGRVCLFETTDAAWHRVEKVSRPRRSLSVYFYDPKDWHSPEFAARTKAAFAAG